MSLSRIPRARAAAMARSTFVTFCVPPCSHCLHSAGGSLRERCAGGIICVEKCDAVWGESFYKLCFGIHECFLRAKESHVLLAYECDNSHCRFCNAAEQSDFPLSVRTHFNDEHFRWVISPPGEFFEKPARHTHLRIHIRGSCLHISASENAREKFFHCRFSNASCYPYDREIWELLAQFLGSVHSPPLQETIEGPEEEPG